MRSSLSGDVHGDAIIVFWPRYEVIDSDEDAPAAKRQRTANPDWLAFEKRWGGGGRPSRV